MLLQLIINEHFNRNNFTVQAGIVDYPTEYIHSSAGFYLEGIKPPIDI
jgi:hypothetical protein